MLVENSAFQGRLPHPKRVAELTAGTAPSCPKFAVAQGPHSPFWAELNKSQSGLKLPLMSFQARLVCVAAAPTGAGLPVVAITTTYLPMLAFSAVLPLPNRS